LPVLHGGRVGRLGRRRGRPGSERVEGRERVCSARRTRRCLRDRGGGLPWPPERKNTDEAAAASASLRKASFGVVAGGA
jgi:hypothetical protein